MAKNDIGNALTRGHKAASTAVRNFFGPQPRYSAEIAPRPNGDGNRLVVTVDDLYIGDILDSPVFKESENKHGRYLSDAQKEIIYRFEHSTQQALKPLGPRKYSGLHQYSHITGNLQIAFEIAKKAGVPLDYVLLLVFIGHERIEDHERVRKPLGDWKNAVTTFNKKERLRLESILKATRAELKEELHQELFGYLKRTGVKGAEKRQLGRATDFAVNIVYDVTRFSDVVPYPFSMSGVYSRNGSELLINTWRRSFAKDVDRISGLRETGAVNSKPAMRRLNDAFEEEGEVGQELRDRYGKVRGDAVEMPRAIKVREGIKTLFTLQPQNTNFNEYGFDNSNIGRTAEVLELARHSQTVKIEATIRVLDEVIARYEKDKTIKNIKPQIDGEMRINERGNYYDGITADGFIIRWVGYDAGGSAVVRARDETAEGRIDTYRAARDLRQQIVKFGMAFLGDSPNLAPIRDIYGSGRRDYRHFELGGVDEALNPVRGERFWELVGRLRSKAQQPATNGGRLWFF